MSNPIYKTSSKAILSLAYNVDVRTFVKWIKPIEANLGAYIGKTYTPKQVSKIVALLGEPELIDLIRV